MLLSFQLLVRPHLHSVSSELAQSSPVAESGSLTKSAKSLSISANTTLVFCLFIITFIVKVTSLSSDILHQLKSVDRRKEADGGEEGRERV